MSGFMSGFMSSSSTSIGRTFLHCHFRVWTVEVIIFGRSYIIHRGRKASWASMSLRCDTHKPSDSSKRHGYGCRLADAAALMPRTDLLPACAQLLLFLRHATNAQQCI